MVQIHSTTTSIQGNQPQHVKNKSGNIIQENRVEKAATESAQQNQPRAEVSVEEVNQALENFNKVFKPTHLEFQLHETSGKYFVHIIDDTTKDVIRQIPSEDFLEMIAEAKAQQGLLIDKRI